MFAAIRSIAARRVGGVVDTRLVSRSGTQRLTDVETVRVGRLLVEKLGVAHVHYPAPEPTVSVVIREWRGNIPESVVAKLGELIGSLTPRS